MSDDGRANALAHFEQIKEWYYRGNVEGDLDSLLEEIYEHPLFSIEVSSGWVAPHMYGEEAPQKYRIVITCGGPHAEITGELSEHYEPTSAKITFSWHSEQGTLWESEDHEALLWYVSLHYYGD